MLAHHDPWLAVCDGGPLRTVFFFSPLVSYGLWIGENEARAGITDMVILEA